MLQQLNLVGFSNEYTYPLVDSQRTVNMYIHADKRSLVPVLIDMPGYQEAIEIVSSPPGVGRNLFTKFNSNRMYGAIGDKIYLFDTLLVPAVLGTINTLVGNVSIAANNSQEIIFVDGTDGYLFEEGTSTFSTITTPGFPAAPEFAVYLDGYFIVNDSGTNQFYVSSLNDGNAWDALRVASLTAQPDNIVGLGTVHRQLFLLGEISTEVWYNAGGSDFPFRRQENLILPYGCIAPGSIASGENSLIWLSGNENGVGSIVMTTGTIPIPISTPNIDISIQSYSTVSDAKAYIYKIDGHIFYEINFTAANHTWVYDLTTEMWFEREYEDGGRYKGQAHAYFLNRHFLLLYDNDNLYELSGDYINHDTAIFRRERTGIRLKDPVSNRIIVDEIGINFLQGVGTSTGIYREPTVFISLSEDGGVTFGARIPASLGKIGERTYKTEWHRLGIFNNLVIKLEFFAEVRLIVLDGYINYTICEV